MVSSSNASSVLPFQAAAVERLEESKNKIEGLLDWISNIGNENGAPADRLSQENGNLPAETPARGLMSEDDAANGNSMQTTDGGLGRENDTPLDLDKQLDRVKVKCRVYYCLTQKVCISYFIFCFFHLALTFDFDFLYIFKV